VVSKLREEAVAEGQGARFEQMKEFLTVGKGGISYGEVARGLLMEEGALRVAVHRLRKRYRELLRREVAETLSDPAMVEDELAVLLGAFG
jgi:RNA polymerase sigma-70 factor (ECF subfamily)